MRAHKIKVVVQGSQQLKVDIPSDFPPGEADLILIAAEPAPAKAPDEPASFEKRFPRDPMLGPIVFRVDPTAPMSEEDWPSEHRP